MNSTRFNIFIFGAKKILPIIPGVIPFGLIMGSLAVKHGLSVFETMSMNIIVFAGASQLAAVELMSQNSPAFIVILTGVVINLRFIMYSASLAPLMTEQASIKKIGLAYLATDQSYAVSVNEFGKFNNNADKTALYLGASVAMALSWHLSVLAGTIFGNFAPAALSLDFAVPLAFMSLVLPSITNKTLLVVVTVSSIAAVLAQSLPYNLGLIVATTLAMAAGIFMDSYRENKKEVS